MTTLSNPGYSPGTIITGKWRKNRYIVERMLGKGANGKVYLVQRAGVRERYALKVGYDALDLQSEINVLQALKEQMPDPYLVEADDHSLGSEEVSFYVMRYIEGSPLHRFIRKRGTEWLGLVGLKLLEKLVVLHGSGYVFGDLKPDNVMVSAYGRVELIDYGGVSSFGRSVKQFTEWYDRGYWNAGSRTGDVGYDLFSFAVMYIGLLDEPALREAACQLPQTRGVSDLQHILRKNPAFKPYASWLAKALSGEFADSREALNEWRSRIYETANRRIRNAPVRTPRWLRNAFGLSLAVLACALYFFLRS
ncbi:serine/threonine protein kinase PrkT [Paenibacillus sp. JCM 10914]|uniref:protein kinase domain-containing protein n=1 Tax=Paenibacillus sp. JCM 10914 TaxID=1236974 RepID=UPI0003CC2AEB|nr:serine/threonine protein kinase [Paenibacillus sp. JCM 10914]GAE09863.1 probable serine/threonine-protein kinase yabT [Paenibacillus sp. JCM 10914]